MNITMQGKYQTRDGRAVEILRTNVKNRDFPVVGIYTEPDGSETQDRWTAEGWYLRPITGVGCPLDLIPSPTKHQAWAWISDDGRVLGFCDRNKTMMQASREPNEHVRLVTWED